MPSTDIHDLLSRSLIPAPLVAFPSASLTHATARSSSSPPRTHLKSNPLSTWPRSHRPTQNEAPEPIAPTSSTPKALGASTSAIPVSSRPSIPSSGLEESSFPSRIPRRPRSASQLANLPSDSRPMSPPHLSPPSGIPISKARSSSASKAARISPRLDSGRANDGFIMHEPPPFKVRQDNDVQKLEVGYVLTVEEREMEEDSAKRKRAETMSPSQRNRQDSGIPVRPGSSRKISSGSEGGKGGTRPATSAAVPRGIPKMPAGSSLGIGQPSTRKVSAPVTLKGRSPTLAQGANCSTPRSASLNMLPSSSSSATSTPTFSRLGVAAHFIPPETTYTPPKGANWDEVVLPTVAKKLGIGERDRVVGEERDLAVEWDRDGTPVKWIKRTVVLRVDTSSFEAGNTSGLSDDDFNANRSSSSPSSFSPTFEPSPNNPHRPEAPPRQSFVGRKRSGETLDLQPVRATLAPTTTLSHDHPDLSPPISTLSARNRPLDSPTESRRQSPLLSHKSSSLQPQVSPIASRRPSQLSVRHASYKNLRTPTAIQVQAATPATMQMTREAEIAPQRIPDPAQGSKPLLQPPAAATNGKRKTDTEEVGKGCGCIVM